MTQEPDAEITTQETQVTEESLETPSEVVATDEQTVVEEKPEQSDSEDQVAETVETKETAGKTADQVQEDAAHWQTKYQESQDELSSLMDGIVQPEATPAPDQPAAPLPQMTDDEVDEALRDPRVQMQVMGERVRQTMREEFKTMQGEERHRVESLEANRVLQKFRHDQKVGDKDFDSAQKSVLASGLQGSPAAINSAIIKELNYQRMMSHMATKTKQVEVDTAEKVKRGLLTQQPSAGGTELKAKDANQAIADAIAPKTT